MNEAENRNRNVLGRAVHPAALRRLHELFPKATVTVEHVVYRVPLAEGTLMKMDGPRDRAQHSTRVWIDLDGDWQRNCGRMRPAHAIYADSTCHPDDRYERREGISIAFGRALNIARKSHQRREWETAQRTLPRRSA